MSIRGTLIIPKKQDNIQDLNSKTTTVILGKTIEEMKWRGLADTQKEYPRIPNLFISLAEHKEIRFITLL